jgi:hypothetical protein
VRGITAQEQDIIRNNMRKQLHPVQVDMQKQLTVALAALQEGQGATKRLLLKRWGLREDNDGEFRPINDPMPTPMPAQRVTGSA